MVDIELVIKISEKAYNALTHIEFDANLVVDEMRNAIVNGTPLPKGHGDLKDMDDIYEAIEGRVDDTDLIMDSIECQAPTIIEADRSEE
jgi:hypothetical protein